MRVAPKCIHANLVQLGSQLLDAKVVDDDGDDEVEHHKGRREDKGAEEGRRRDAPAAAREVTLEADTIIPLHTYEFI